MTPFLRSIRLNLDWESEDAWDLSAPHTGRCRFVAWARVIQKLGLPDADGVRLGVPLRCVASSPWWNPNERSGVGMAADWAGRAFARLMDPEFVGPEEIPLPEVAR